MRAMSRILTEGYRRRDLFIRLVFGLEMFVSELGVGGARSTASIVVLSVRFLCWWLSDATSIVGDRMVPALIGFIGWSFGGEWGAVV